MLLGSVDRWVGGSGAQLVVASSRPSLPFPFFSFFSSILVNRASWKRWFLVSALGGGSNVVLVAPFRSSFSFPFPFVGRLSSSFVVLAVFLLLVGWALKFSERKLELAVGSKVFLKNKGF